MPQYEIVAHFAVELDGTIPEEAAGIFRREWLAGTGMNLRDLAVWPSAQGTRPSPLPPSLREQLARFFAAVARHAAVEEEVFRARVEEILASVASDDAHTAPPEHAMANKDDETGNASWPS